MRFGTKTHISKESFATEHHPRIACGTAAPMQASRQAVPQAILGGCAVVKNSSRICVLGPKRISSMNFSQQHITPKIACGTACSDACLGAGVWVISGCDTEGTREISYQLRFPK